jgi:hypothetical protein
LQVEPPKRYSTILNIIYIILLFVYTSYLDNPYRNRVFNHYQERNKMFKYKEYKIGFVLSMLLTTSAFAEVNHVENFKQAWDNPSYTQIELPPIDINKVITTYYKTSSPVKFTKSMLWDMEVKKAYHPEIYISHVVNSAHSWMISPLSQGKEFLARVSEQRVWVKSEYGTVLEEVFLDHKNQKAIFIGTPYIIDNKGDRFHATNKQPLFHVEHGVGGSETNPTNTWRIVHFTEKKDAALLAIFSKIGESTDLPFYVTTYIEKNLGVEIKRLNKM